MKKILYFAVSLFCLARILAIECIVPEFDLPQTGRRGFLINDCRSFSDQKGFFPAGKAKKTTALTLSSFGPWLTSDQKPFRFWRVDLDSGPTVWIDSRNIALYIRNDKKISCWYTENPIFPPPDSYPNKDFYDFKKAVLIKYDFNIALNTKTTKIPLGTLEKTSFTLFRPETMEVMSFDDKKNIIFTGSFCRGTLLREPESGSGKMLWSESGGMLIWPAKIRNDTGNKTSMYFLNSDWERGINLRRIIIFQADSSERTIHKYAYTKDSGADPVLSDSGIFNSCRPIPEVIECYDTPEDDRSSLGLFHRDDILRPLEIGSEVQEISGKKGFWVKVSSKLTDLTAWVFSADLLFTELPQSEITRK